MQDNFQKIKTLREMLEDGKYPADMQKMAELEERLSHYSLKALLGQHDGVQPVLADLKALYMDIARDLRDDEELDNQPEKRMVYRIGLRIIGQFLGIFTEAEREVENIRAELDSEIREAQRNGWLKT